MIDEKAIDKLIGRVHYNATDMGELGRYVKEDYVLNAIDEMIRESQMRRRPVSVPIVCKQCGTRVLGRRTQRYCSTLCRQRHYREANYDRLREQQEGYRNANRAKVRRQVRESTRRWRERQEA